MKRFTAFLKEDKRIIKIDSTKSLRKLLKTDYSDAYKALQDGFEGIWRGDKNLGYYFILDPAATPRQSRNTLNYYTIIIDQSNAWKDYPKRSRSAICSTRFGKARSYDKAGWGAERGSLGLYCVLPINGGKIGCCPQDDIWESFEPSFEGTDIDYLSEFNRILAQRSRSLGFIIEKGDPDQKYEESLYRIGEWLMSIDIQKERGGEGMSGTWDFWKKLKESWNDNLSAIDNFGEFLNPKNNKFELKTVNEMNNDRFQGEVWLDCNCLMIQSFSTVQPNQKKSINIVLKSEQKAKDNE